MRDRLFNMRVNDEEWLRLNALANHYGITAADTLRMLLKERADAVAAAARTCTCGAARS